MACSFTPTNWHPSSLPKFFTQYGLSYEDLFACDIMIHVSFKHLLVLMWSPLYWCWCLFLILFIQEKGWPHGLQYDFILFSNPLFIHLLFFVHFAGA